MGGVERGKGLGRGWWWGRRGGGGQGNGRIEGHEEDEVEDEGCDG